MTTQLRELSPREIDAVSGGNDQGVYSAGLTLSLAGIAMVATGAGAPIGLALGVGGVVVMASSWLSQ